MSTKKIRELIENAGNIDDFLRCQLAEEAMAEVEAIEKAAREVVGFVDMMDHGEAGWSLLKSIAKESK